MSRIGISCSYMILVELAHLILKLVAGVSGGQSIKVDVLSALLVELSQLASPFLLILIFFTIFKRSYHRITREKGKHQLYFFFLDFLDFYQIEFFHPLSYFSPLKIEVTVFARQAAH